MKRTKRSGRLEVAPVEHEPARVDVPEQAQVVVGGVGAGQPDDELPSHHRFEAHAVLLRRMRAVTMPTPVRPSPHPASM